MKKIVIVGGGFVGQNVAVFLADKGFDVTIVDIDPLIVDLINNGQTVLKEDILVTKWRTHRDKIKASTSYKCVSEADVVIVAVNTPVKVRGDELLFLLFRGERDIDKYVDFCPLENAAKELSKHIKHGTLISIESTLYPGGTKNRFTKYLEEAGFIVGRDLYLVHVPERVDPGNVKWFIDKIPRVMGALDDNSLKKGVEFYKNMLGLEIYSTEMRIAEMSKLYENTYRLVNIAYAQEVMMRSDVNFLEVIKAVKTKPFGIQIYYPGPYAGGACLVKDALMLYAITGSEIVKRALIINELTPKLYAQKIHQKLKSLNAKKVLFHGLGFKPNVPYYINDHLNPIARIILELKKIYPDLVIHKYDPLLPELSDVKSPNFNDYDVVIKWNYEEILSFITS